MDEVRFREALLNIELMIRGALSTGDLADSQVRSHLVGMLENEVENLVWIWPWAELGGF